jgi:multicomponent Na+:H+ antiporter subunit D
VTFQPIVAFALPGFGALLLWLWRPSPATARRVTLVLGLVLLGVAAHMVALAHADAVGAHAFGNWAPPFGITFVVDRLAALLVGLVAVLLVVVTAALKPSSHGSRTVARALPLLLFLTFGLNGAFMTGDLFNLFVMFELVLLSSYLLLQVPGTKRSRRVAFSNVVINLLASLLFFGGVGVIYGLCGSVNLADVAARLPDAPADLKVAALAMLVVAFGTKTGLVPLVFWLPSTYPVTSAPIAAFFAGIMTKLGGYALLRIAPLLLDGTGLPTLLVWVGAASALLGVLAALSQYELRRLLAFHSVSQMGYVVASLGLVSAAGFAGAIYFIVHHALVKSSLYLVADHLERRHRTRDLRKMPAAALAGSHLGAWFFLAAITLAGLPPTSGFIGKVAVFVAGFEAGAYLPLSALVAASLFTLASMIKIWQYAFQRGPASTPDSASKPPGGPLSSLRPLAALVIATVVLAAAAGPATRYAQATARDLLDTERYIDRVRSVEGYTLAEATP